MSALIEPIVTVEDLAAMPDDSNRYEVIEGEISVSRAPDFVHQVATSNLIGSINPYLKNNPIGTIVPTPGLILSPIDGVIPDLVYMSNERRDEILREGKLHAAPELVIEILSPGTENIRRDRIVKRQLYAKHGVEEYWVIDAQMRTLEVYRLRDALLDLIAMYAKGDTVTTALLPDWNISIEELFAV